MVAIPIEIFGLFIAISAVLIGIGITKKIGVAVLCGGIFLFAIGAITDIVKLGIKPTTSITSGSTTTYTFVDDNFSFTQTHRLMMVLMGVIVMVLGAIIRE